ncbi:MAG: DNA-directed RNA polymerase subunit alpha [Planctomycetota bacterium]
MRIKWRGLELPSQVELDQDVSTDQYGRFVIEPFERGFGTTVGNSLRRVLLSSLRGAAVATVKIAGVAHEFTTLPGVLEDVTDIILNVKSLVVGSDSDEPKTMSVTRDTRGEVRAADIMCDPAITIVNRDLVLATLTNDVPFKMDMTVRTGRGYATAEENMGPEQEIGVIPVDSVFSPVERVRYKTEETRVGQRTNYDRLILEVWTKGTISPEDALVEAAKILRKHLNPFVQYHELGSEVVTEPPEIPAVAPDQTAEWQTRLERPVSDLELSVRASNCLEAARIRTVGELIQKTEADLLRVRSFGKTSLREVKRKLADWGLGLGMNLDEGEEIHPPPSPLMPDLDRSPVPEQVGNLNG